MKGDIVMWQARAAVHTGLAAAALAGVAIAIAPAASAQEVVCGDVAYPNSRMVGTLVVHSAARACADARAVLEDYFGEVFPNGGFAQLDSSSPLRGYDCETDFERRGGMRGYTECRYIIGEGNDADGAVQIDVLPK